MNHEKIKLLLSAFYDGELPASEQSEVERHAQDCAECSEQIRLWQNLRQAVFNQPEPQASWQFTQAVMSAIQPPTAQVNWLDAFNFFQWKTVYVLASVFVVAVYSFSALENHAGASAGVNMTILVGANESGIPNDEQWMFSQKDLEKEDAMQMLLGGSDENI